MFVVLRLLSSSFCPLSRRTLWLAHAPHGQMQPRLLHPPVVPRLPAHLPARRRKWLSVVPIGFGNAVVFQTVCPSLHARVLVVGRAADAFVWDGCVSGTLVGCVVVRLGVQVGAEGKLTCGFRESQLAFGTEF